MFKFSIHSFLLVIITSIAFGQDATIEGNFPGFQVKKVTLSGFDSLEEIKFNVTTTDTLGYFKLNLPPHYLGFAKLKIDGVTDINLLINNTTIRINESEVLNNRLPNIDPINNSFFTNNQLYQQLKNKENALRFLMGYYNQDSRKKEWIMNEIELSHSELIKITSEKTTDPLVLKYIYLNFILDEMDANWTSKPYLISLLEKIDFSDVAFQHSPYFNKVIQKIISIASILDAEEDNAFYTKIIKKLFSELNTNTPLKNKVAIYCFKQMESLGYSNACQQLSDIILSGKPILIPSDELYLFESYRKLALGTKAPDFALNFPLSNTNSTLFKTKSKYKLLYFGSSECPACNNEWYNLLDLDKKTNKDIEVLYISRDENVELFNTHFKNSGLLVHSDFTGWNSKPFLEYAIIVTPSLVLIDNHNKIVYKSSNINEISEWIKNNNTSNTKSNSL